MPSSPSTCAPLGSTNGASPLSCRRDRETNQTHLRQRFHWALSVVSGSSDAERGIPILCEKPIALSLADADEMVRAVETTDVPTVVNLKFRFSEALKRLRAYLIGGGLGDLLACWLRTFRGYGFYGVGVRHRAVVRPDLSGGWVVHHVIHAADWLVVIDGPLAS